MGQSASEQLFNAWINEVKAIVPKGKLLVHEAKEGWKPLCKFLGVPEPLSYIRGQMIHCHSKYLYDK